MATGSIIEESIRLQSREAGRRTNPLRSAPPGNAARGGLGVVSSDADRAAGMAPAVGRRSGQFPAFAPLLDELEIAGWSSHRRQLGGNFHDWLMLDSRQMLVGVGQAVGPDPLDTTEAALVAQAAWATIRAHATHVRDAGDLLSMAGRSLWPVPNAAVQAAVAVALLDTADGHASVAMAGDCLAWRIRAAFSEQLAIDQPMLGGAADFTYGSHSVQLSLRERLLLVADNPLQRSARQTSAIAASFAQLDAESHRRMLAADAVALVRRHYEQDAADPPPPASIIAVRRR